MSTRWRGSTAGPRSMIVPSTSAPVQVGLYHEAQLPSVHVRRGGQASTRAGDYSSPWQAMRSRHHQGGSGIGTSKGGSSRVTGGRNIRRLCVQQKQGQQLGRTRYRERQGSTGRAGRSKARERLTMHLFIAELLLCRSVGHFRHQPHRYEGIPKK
jgi:hypothetical protein